MKTTITGLYDHYDDAKAAVKALEDAGVPSDDISIVTNKANGDPDIQGQGNRAGEQAAHLRIRRGPRTAAVLTERRDRYGR